MSPQKDLVRISLLGLAFTGTDAFWRLPCRGRSGLGLIDPIVDPGAVSDHAHTVHGSGNFGLDATNANMMQGNCTSCGVQEDMSTYWTPPLYFMYPNKTSVMLEQEGGMLAYYLLQGEDLVEFPQGFQMIAGNAHRRNFTCKEPEPPKSLWSGHEVSQDGLQQKALGFNCLNYAKTPEPSLGRHGMPSKQFIDDNCPDGLRLELFFPSCWNGEDATSPDFHSHMAYPSLVNGGDCPQGYPKRTASLFFETIWNTAPFKGVEGQFVLSQGDLTGYGYHGDFMMGWQKGHLQNAIETCTNPSGEVSDCPLFTLNSEDDMNQCKFETLPQAAEPGCTGPMQGLPGGNQLSNGPEPVIPMKGAAGSSSVSTSSKSTPASPHPYSPTASRATSAYKPSSYAVSSQPPAKSTPISSDPQSAAMTRQGSSTGDLVFAQAATETVTPTAAPASYSAPSSEASPTPSAAPVSAAAAACDGSTKIISGAAEYDICITDVTEYVTASTAPQPELHKRHLHDHIKHRHAGRGNRF
ncbi:MAG: hypothetical protein Q9159_000177 [Coniocarpon cinnabarinum]